MKTKDFKAWVFQLTQLLQTSGPSDVQENLRLLLKMFDGHETKMVAACLKKAKDLKPEPNKSPPRVSTVLPTLKQASAFIENCAKAGYKNDLIQFRQFLEANESANVQSMVQSVASALKSIPKTKRKTARRNLDQKQIDEFIRRLTANFENEETFMAVCDELANNNNITQLDAVAIARGIDFRTPARASKKVALGRVVKRFEELKKNRTKALSMAGRSAA